MRRLITYVLAALGVACGIGLAGSLRLALNEEPPKATGSVSVPDAVSAPPSPTVAEIVDRHLHWADEQGMSGILPQLKPIAEFFDEAALGTRGFAEDSLGWWSKWKLATDYVTGGDEHRKYLEERFAARIFAPEDLEQTIQSVVASYLNHLDDVDQTLLVNLRADLEGIPANGFGEGIDRAAIEESLMAAMDDAIRAVETDFQGMVGRELVSFIAGEVLTVASVELATSAGILTAGASSGTVTFGVGLVVGVIVDSVVSWAYDELFDPAGELSWQLEDTLLELEDLIIAGNGEYAGLVQRLVEYGSRRGQARKAAITAVVLPQGGLNTTPAF